jgi:RNA polymerase sigma-70 factor (ECF subfamily)
MYMRGEDGDWHAFQLHVLTLTAAGISHVVVFFDLSLFQTFGFPLTLPADKQLSAVAGTS